ncbi:26383_t:CDS:1 [Racocetra persica]|uniref:26383_t:CDS:1 n=1 Tax=Racocetra persica TaxID=160502 RepID=A0ACA9KGT2_9GLOM|nr:26383_t:CDS:1 [Racocetra persica]
MIKFVLLLLTILALLLSNVKCEPENNQINDLSTRDPWLLDNDHFSSPFDEFMTSKQDIHSNPFQAIDDLVDMSIEATEAMLDSLNFDNFNDEDSSVTTIEITIVGSPDLPSNEIEIAIDDISKITLDDESIQDQQYDPFMDFSFQGCEPDDENSVIPTIVSLEISQDSYSSKDDDDENDSFFNQSILDYLFGPLFMIFIVVAALVAVIPVILSIRGKKEKKYEYFVVHATDECQTADLENATCVKK